MNLSFLGPPSATRDMRANNAVIFRLSHRMCGYREKPRQELGRNETVDMSLMVEACKCRLYYIWIRPFFSRVVM
jgi:hypothetical protein